MSSPSIRVCLVTAVAVLAVCDIGRGQGLYNSNVIFQLGSGANTFYWAANSNNGYAQFSGNLFSIAGGTSLRLGGNLSTFPGGGDSNGFHNAGIGYSFNGASFTELNLPFHQNVDGSNDQWETLASSGVQLGDHLNVGTQTLSVYFRAQHNGDNADYYQNNGGSNYSATFSVTAGTYSYQGGNGDLYAEAQYSNGLAPGNGHNITFSNASGGSVTNNNLTSVNSLAFDSGSGGFTLSGNALTVNAGITNNSGSAQTINNNLKVGADQSFVANSGLLSFAGNVDTNGRTLTVTGADNTAFSGRVTGTGNLVKDGSGIVFLDGSYSGNGHTGSTTVNGGTLRAGVGSLVQTSSPIQVNNGGTLLLFGAGRHIGANTGVTLNGGTFDTGGFSEPGGTPDGSTGSNHIGALTLTATSTISFGVSNSSVLEFSSVGSHTSGRLLSIINWNGVVGTGGSGDRLLFTGLETSFITAYQQNEVSFNGSLGYSTFQFLDGSNSPYFEVLGLVPIPEPSTWGAGILALGALAFSQRRRICDSRATVE